MKYLSKWRWEISALAAGMLLTAAFAPYGYAYASLLSLALLYATWFDQSAKRAAWRGYLFGLGLFGSGTWWLYISIHDFGGGSVWSAVALTAAFAASMALFPALAGALAARLLRQRHVLLRLWSVALLWVSLEYLRGYWLLNGFPWLQIAYSQLDTPLAGYAPLLGVYGLGFMLAISAFMLAEIGRRKLRPIAGLLLLLLVWGTGALLKTVQWTQQAGDPVKITLVQGNIDQAEKWLPEQRLNTLMVYRHLTQQHWDSNVIIWPEMAIPMFLSEVESFFVTPLANEARQHGVDLVLSAPTEGAGLDYYNSVLSLGRSPGIYHKNHLLPFGEYLPLQPLSGWILAQINIPLGTFSAGADRQTLLQAGGKAFITTICYEDAFGEQVTRQIADAAYIVNVTNDGWFGDSSQPHQHLQMAQMRALETGRYLLRATNTGLTAIVDAKGKIQQQLPLFVRATLTGDILPMAGVTPYARLGDGYVFAGMFLMLGFLLFAWRKQGGC